MTSTVLLDANWDWVADANGDLAWADDSVDNDFATAQDVASACKTIAGECWYDTSLGVTYLTDIFGKPLVTSYIVNQLVTAAKTITGVTAANVVALALTNTRQLTGRILVSTATSSTPIEVTF